MQEQPDLHSASERFVSELSNKVTSASLQLPRTFLDELVFTAWYTQTAVVLSSLNGVDDRYFDDQSMLDNDISAGPLIIRRLERWAEECPEGSITREFASKYLPTVRNFYESLQAYKSRQNPVEATTE